MMVIADLVFKLLILSQWLVNVSSYFHLAFKDFLHLMIKIEQFIKNDVFFNFSPSYTFIEFPPSDSLNY